MNKQIKQRMLTLGTSAALATVALTIALPAQAVDFSVSGQVNRALIAADNGKKSDVGFVDSVGSNSRFRFVGSQDMGNNNTLGFTYEIGLADNTSTEWDIKKNSGAKGNTAFVDQRVASVWLKGDYGRFEFGKLAAASDGSSELDYSGTAFLGGGNMSYYASGIRFTHKNPDANGRYNTDIRLADVSNNFDGLGRQNGIKYTTPSFSGLTVSAGVYDGHAWDIAPRYEVGFGDGGKFGAVLSYLNNERLGDNQGPDGRIDNNRSKHYKEYGGTASVLLPVGLNFTGSYKKRKYSVGQDSKNFFAGIGYSFGSNHLQVGYTESKDWLSAGKEDTDDLSGIVPNGAAMQYGNVHSKAKEYSLAYVYDYNSAIQAYASYHLMKMNDLRDGTHTVKFKDVNYIFTGVRVKFM